MEISNQTLFDRSLTRAAEIIGDLNAPMFERYYARFPGGREEFEAWACGDLAQLEAMMADNCLYCLMTWIENPLEVEMLFLQSVPHHAQTLNILPDRFVGLLEAMIDVIAESVPPEAADERALWRDMRTDLRDVIESAASEV